MLIFPRLPCKFSIQNPLDPDGVDLFGNSKRKRLQFSGNPGVHCDLKAGGGLKQLNAGYRMPVSG